MKRILRNWNPGKHLALVLSFYTTVTVVLNVIMYRCTVRKAEKQAANGGNWISFISPEEKKRAIARKYFTSPSKAWKIAHGIIGFCMAIDLLSYPIIKKMSDKL